MPWSLFQFKRAFDEVYEQCDESLQRAVDRRAAKLMEFGPRTRYPVSAPVGDAVFELRADSKRTHVRFFYFFRPEQKIIILLGAFKSKRRIQREISQAKNIRETLLAHQELLDEITEIN